jgi:hypothetical protein
MEIVDMSVSRYSNARFLTRVLALVAIVGCGGTDTSSPNTNAHGVLAGSYVATTFQVTPDGQGLIDVLAQGGSLTIVLESDNSVAGTLQIPASATGGQAVTASLNGTVSFSGNTVVFQAGGDTFVRNLTWTIGTNMLSVTNQHAGIAVFTIVLTRQ